MKSNYFQRSWGIHRVFTNVLDDLYQTCKLLKDVEYMRKAVPGENNDNHVVKIEPVEAESRP